MSECYDRSGKPMTMDEWSGRLKSERRVAETTLPDGKWVSTIWLGLNHQYGDGPPLIFETMVFASGNDMSEHDMARYSTEEEAIAGHEAMVKKWTKST